MEFVITQGQFEIHPIPGPDGESRAGYLLNIIDQATGIVVRVSMAHANAAQLGQVLVQDTEEHPAPITLGEPLADEGFLRVVPPAEPEQEGA